MKQLLWILCFLLLSLSAKAQLENALLWKVESPDGKESYIFGTYHLLGSDYLKDHPRVKSAYTQAEKVVVETVVDSSEMMQLGMASLMPGKSLRAMVDSAGYQLLKQKLEPVLGMDLILADQMKPMALSAAYALHLAQQSTPEDFDFEGEPIDLYFAANAKENQTVKPLESMQEQMDILYGSQTEEEQAQELMELVQNEEQSKELTRSIIKAYQNNNLNAMLTISLEFEEAYGEMEVVLDQRNQKWLEQLKPLLNDERLFIAVGALHLPGENGLINLLRQEGYQVKAVK